MKPGDVVRLKEDVSMPIQGSTTSCTIHEGMKGVVVSTGDQEALIDFGVPSSPWEWSVSNNTLALESR